MIYMVLESVDSKLMRPDEMAGRFGANSTLQVFCCNFKPAPSPPKGDRLPAKDSQPLAPGFCMPLTIVPQY